MQAYIVPSEDPHQSEYAAACYERRQFISRFTVRACVARIARCASAASVLRRGARVAGVASSRG